jgi:hypothetical protein
MADAHVDGNKGPESEGLFVTVSGPCVCTCVRVCVRARVCVRVYVHVYVYVKKKEGRAKRYRCQQTCPVIKTQM